MRLTCFLLLFSVTVLSACSKKKDGSELKAGSYRGVYIETSMRKDTIDFNKGFALWDIAGAPTGVAGLFYFESSRELTPGNIERISELYSYAKEGSLMKLGPLRSYILTPSPVAFKWIRYDQSFTIGKFYNREELPDKLEFEKID